jgi:hypothetical protein
MDSFLKFKLEPSIMFQFSKSSNSPNFMPCNSVAVTDFDLLNFYSTFIRFADYSNQVMQLLSKLDFEVIYLVLTAVY